jgi:hypothetical protein
VRAHRSEDGRLDFDAVEARDVVVEKAPGRLTCTHADGENVAWIGVKEHGQVRGYALMVPCPLTLPPAVDLEAELSSAADHRHVADEAFVRCHQLVAGVDQVIVWQ